MSYAPFDVWRATLTSQGNGDAHTPESMSSEDRTAELDCALDNLNTRLAKLHSSLPANTALIIMTGHSDPLPLLQLTARRTKWERLLKTLGGAEGITGEERWMAEDDRELERRANEAREGMAFFCVK